MQERPKSRTLSRYAKNQRGKIVKVADIYPSSKHNIDQEKIDADVFRIAQALKSGGYQAYLVGGAVRDLLLGHRPKDFDLVTQAIPSEIRSLIPHSRVIGKRFRLVHVWHPNGKIIEVITFRALDSAAHNPQYGTITEDVQRRDFSINALYYDLNNQQLLDFVGAMADFDKQRMRNVIPLKQIFSEDPVRIVRCLKYAAKTGFAVPRKLALQLRRDSKLLLDCSKSRLAEELSKILCSEQCADIFQLLQQYDICKILLPCLDPQHDSGAYHKDREQDLLEWSRLLQQHYQIEEQAAQAPNKGRKRKKRSKEQTEKTPEGLLGKNLLGIGLSYLFASYLQHSDYWAKPSSLSAEEQSLALFQHLKGCLNELNIANIEVFTACKQLCLRQEREFVPRLILKKYHRIDNSGQRPRKKTRKGRRPAPQDSGA